LTESETRSRGRLAVFALLGITVVGLGLRILAAVGTQVEAPLRADAGQYYTYAYNLRHHGVYSDDLAGLRNPNATLKPDAYRSPGYPLFLVPLIGDAATEWTVVNITLVQALLGAGLVAVVYAFARQSLPAWAALGAALLVALSPHLVNAGVYVLSEVLFAFVLGLAFALLASGARRGGRMWLLAGAVLGVAALTRPTVQYLIIPLGLLVFLSTGLARRRTATVLLVVGFALALGPWLIRNELSLGTLGDDRLKIDTLHHGMYPGLMYQDNPRSYGFPYRYDPRTSEIRRSMSSVLAEIARRFREEPLRHLKWYLLGKPVQLWSWDIVQGMGDTFIYPVSRTPYARNPLFEVTYRIMHWLHGPLLLLAALGAVLAWLPGVAERYAPGPLLGLRACSLLLIYYTAVHMAGAPFPRYSVPALPFVYVMALSAVAMATALLRRTPAEAA
jgi:hypothetical protein